MKKIARKVFAVLLAITMLIISMPTSVIAEEGDTTDTNIGANEGVGEKTFIEIYTIEDLYNVRNDLAANYILMNDIDLTTATAEGGDYDFMGNGWNPIGSGDVYSNNAFSGEFDGNCKKIIGMRIDITTLPSGTGTIYAGLFANVTGSVKDLTITGDVYYNCGYNGNYIGSIVGYCDGTIDCCINYANVKSSNSGNGYVGGITGSTGSNAVINNCANNGNVNSSQIYTNDDVRRYAGGIVGNAASTTQISYCYNTGDVYSYATGKYYSNYPDDYGYAYSYGIAAAGVISDCYNTGDVTAYEGTSDNSYARTCAEGIGGDTVARCYNIGTVEGISSKYAVSEHVSTNCYYLAGTGNSSTGATSLTEAQMKTQSMFNGFDFNNVWVINNEAEYPYPQLLNNIQDLRIIEAITINSLPSKTEYVMGEELVIDGATICVHIKDDEPQIIPITYDMVGVYDFQTLGTQTITVVYKDKVAEFDIIVNEKPYTEIYTIEDLYNVRQDLKANYILMNDIDLTDATAQGSWDFYGNGWNPIGSGDVYGDGAFQGVFDGNGYTIKGMRIDITRVPSGTTEVYAGLFANVTGTVKNLTLDGGSVNYNYSLDFYIGSVAGAVNGTIENCHSTVNVSGKLSTYSADGYAGGIAGKAGDTAVITNCSNKGDVSSDSYGSTYSGVYDGLNYAGGILGNGTTKTVISKCYNIGNVYASSTADDSSDYGRAYAAGITSVAQVNDSYNTGDIKTKKIYSYAKTYSYGIGGTASSCYNIGKVTGETACYGISNEFSKNCYYLEGTGTTSTGATSLTQLQMKTQSMYVGFNLDDVWFVDNTLAYPYPQLKGNEQELRVLKSVTLSSLPSKVTYNKWEELDVTGAQITFEYENADTVVVDVTTNMVSGYDPLVIGTQTLTVTYKVEKTTYTFNFEVTVNEYEYKEIYTIEDLYNVRQDLKANYILMNDIDLTAATAQGSWDFYGNGWNPIGSGDVYGDGAFQGVFDGNGYTIKGMRIDITRVPSGTTEVYAGLFANVTGTVKNLTLEGGSVNYNYSLDFCIGSVAGAVNGTIENCHSTMNVSGKLSTYSVDGYAGGIAGKAGDTAVITNCSNKGDVSSDSISTSTNSSSVDGDVNYAGGILGNGTKKTVISKCYNTGNVSASSTAYSKNDYGRAYAAGITSVAQVNDSYNTGDIKTKKNYSYAQTYSYGIGGTATSCYNIGKVTGETACYGISNEFSKNCYYLEGTGTTSTGATSLTELQMKTQSMYVGFNLDDVWFVDNTLAYPYPQLKDNVMETREAADNISIVTMPKTRYFVGDAIDLTGGTVKITYVSGSEETVNITADMISGFDTSTTGECTVTITVLGVSTTYTIDVITVVGVSLAAKPNKTEFVKDTTFDFVGAKAQVLCSDNSTELIDITPQNTTGGNINKTGTQTITYTIGGKSVSFEVTVIEVKLESIELSSLPEKREYVIGQKFDNAGLVLLAHYNSGLIEVVNNYTVDANLSKLGVQNVSITFNGMSVYFSVKVIAKVITELKLVSLPAKLEYIKGDAFDTTGLVAQISYNDGTTETITNYEIVGYSSKVGTHTILVSYEGFVCTFDVTVAERELVDVKIKAPTKVEYQLGDIFNVDGLVVTAYYNNGEVEDVKDYQISGFNSSTPGSKIVTVTYGGMSRSFIVIINDHPQIESGGHIVVDSVRCHIGDTITVPVRIDNNVGVAGFTHTIKFDATAFEFVAATAAGSFADGTFVVNDKNAQNGEITIVWFSNTNITSNDVIYNLCFNVYETANDGNSKILIAFEDNGNVNVAGDNVIFRAIDGDVEIRSYWLGDLNGDRIYDMGDLLQLAQYVAGMEMTLTDKQLLSADVNEDGTVDIHDVVMLQQWLLVADI